MLRHVALENIHVSEELSASVIRVTRIDELGTTLAVTSNRRTLRRNTKCLYEKAPECSSVGQKRHIYTGLAGKPGRENPVGDIGEAIVCAATRELPSLVWNPQVHYRIHNTSALVPVLSKVIPVSVPYRISRRTFLVLSLHLCLLLPSDLFHSVLKPITSTRPYCSPFMLYVLSTWPPLWSNGQSS
jgi:hypothetical protein